MIPKLIVCRTDELEHYLQGQQCTVISIIDPGDSIPEALADRPHIPNIVLEFGDTDPYGATEDYPCASVDDIQKVLFAARGLAKIAGKQDILLIHCLLGNSRSTAIALAIWTLWLPTVNMAMAELVRNYPDAQPNRWIVALADRLMNLGDRLWNTLDEYLNPISCKTPIAHVERCVTENAGAL